MKVTWNTGAAYTRDGQIIVAQVQDDGSVLFHDVSRGIGGRIAAPRYGQFDADRPGERAVHLIEYVNAQYLVGAYTGDATYPGAYELAPARNADGSFPAARRHIVHEENRSTTTMATPATSTVDTSTMTAAQLYELYQQRAHAIGKAVISFKSFQSKAALLAAIASLPAPVDTTKKDKIEAKREAQIEKIKAENDKKAEAAANGTPATAPAPKKATEPKPATTAPKKTSSGFVLTPNHRRILRAWLAKNPNAYKHDHGQGWDVDALPAEARKLIGLEK